MKKLKCYLARKFKKLKWHKWEMQYEKRCEYEPSIMHRGYICKYCGDYMSAQEVEK